MRRRFWIDVVVTLAFLAITWAFVLALPAAAPSVEPLAPSTMDRMLALMRAMPNPTSCQEHDRIICCFNADESFRCCNQNSVGDCARAQIAAAADSTSRQVAPPSRKPIGRRRTIPSGGRS